ncbi:MAG: hypothetical protein RLZZ420_1777, partial [Bacteroidota bacterium]
MSIVIYLIAGAFIGILAGWLLAKSTTSKSMQAATALLMQDKNATLAELQS